MDFDSTPVETRDFAGREHIEAAGLRTLRPSIDHDHSLEPRFFQGASRRIGAVVVREHERAASRRDAEPAQIDERRPRHHDAGPVVARESDQPLGGAGRQHHLLRADDLVALPWFALTRRPVRKLLDRAKAIVVVIAEDVGPLEDAHFRHRAKRLDHGVAPALQSRVEQQAAAEQALALTENHARPGAASRPRRRKPGRAAPDDEHVAMVVRGLVGVGIGRIGRPSEPGGATDQRLVDLLPEGGRPHEGLIVEPRRDHFAGEAVDRHEVEGERGPAVLASRDERVEQLDLGRLGVRLRAPPFAEFDQRVRLLRTRRQDSTRSMIFEAAADKGHAIGDQRGGERISRMAFEKPSRRNGMRGAGCGR